MLSRRQLVIASAVIVVLAVAVTISTLLPPLVDHTSPTESQSAVPSADSESTDQTLPTFEEPPIFRERVEAGELPPVEDRLPENPMVIESHDE